MSSGSPQKRGRSKVITATSKSMLIVLLQACSKICAVGALKYENKRGRVLLVAKKKKKKENNKRKKLLWVTAWGIQIQMCCFQNVMKCVCSVWLSVCHLCVCWESSAELANYYCVLFLSLAPLAPKQSCWDDFFLLFLEGLIQLIVLLYWNSDLRRKWSQELLHLPECFGLRNEAPPKK